MTITITKNTLFSSVVALALLTAGITWYVHFQYDPSALAKIDSTPVSEYLQHQRHLHGHSYFYGFASHFIIGGILICAFNLLSSALRAFTPWKSRAEQHGSSNGG